MGQLNVKTFEFFGVSLHFLLTCFLGVQETLSYPRCKDIRRIESDEITVHLSFEKQPSCFMTYQAPMDYKIRVECTLDKLICHRDIFYFFDDIDGKAAELCGTLEFTQLSYMRTVSLMLQSYTAGSSIECDLSVVPSNETCSCGKSEAIGDERTQNPSIISIVKGFNDMYSNLEVICTGAIISHFYILTSATCLTDIQTPNGLFAFYNDVNDSYPYIKYKIEKVLKHPAYTPKTKVNDIAILKTSTPIEWTRRIGPICLPYQRQVFDAHTNAYILGYRKGLAKHRYQLRKENVKNVYKGAYRYTRSSQSNFTGNRNQQNICAYSGAIILNTYNQILYGLTERNDCTHRFRNQEFQEVFLATDIFDNYEWIFKMTGGKFCMM